MLLVDLTFESADARDDWQSKWSANLAVSVKKDEPNCVSYQFLNEDGKEASGRGLIFELYEQKSDLIDTHNNTAAFKRFGSSEFQKSIELPAATGKSVVHYSVYDKFGFIARSSEPGYVVICDQTFATVAQREAWKKAWFEGAAAELQEPGAKKDLVAYLYLDDEKNPKRGVIYERYVNQEAVGDVSAAKYEDPKSAIAKCTQAALAGDTEAASEFKCVVSKFQEVKGAGYMAK